MIADFLELSKINRIIQHHWILTNLIIQTKVLILTEFKGNHRIEVKINVRTYMKNGKQSKR